MLKHSSVHVYRLDCAVDVSSCGGKWMIPNVTCEQVQVKLYTVTATMLPSVQCSSLHQGFFVSVTAHCVFVVLCAADAA